jgi:hygromycin-B 7''-O-kinase
MVFTDTYSQPEAPDPVLPAEVVVAAARRHAPETGGLLAVDESGGEARAYVLEGNVVLKTQRPHRLRPRTSLSKEALILRHLETAGNVPVPSVLGYGDVEGIEYLCLTQIPGKPVESTALSGAARQAALAELGRTLRRVHEVDQGPLQAGALVPGDSSAADLRLRFAESFARLAQLISADPESASVLEIEPIAARCLASLPSDTQPVVLHSNPGPEHAFVDPVTGTFTGLIDFGDAYRSHPALDLRPWSDPADAASLLAGYSSLGPLPEGFRRVRDIGLVIMELARVARGRKGAREAAESIERLLE